MPEHQNQLSLNKAKIPKIQILPLFFQSCRTIHGSVKYLSSCNGMPGFAEVLAELSPLG
jgi:hypothetical protein